MGIIEKGDLRKEWWKAFNKTIPLETEIELANPGYTESRTGLFVPEDKAVEYFIKMLLLDRELQMHFADQFYSNGWEKEEIPTQTANPSGDE